jgi:hypothetical protein
VTRAGPYSAAPSGVVDDDVVDVGSQASKERIDDKGEHPDRPFIEPSHEDSGRDVFQDAVEQIATYPG